MPEGPEIRRAADRIADVLVGETIDTVRFGIPRLRRHAKALRGHRVTNIETRGKALLTHFEHGFSIYSHNQLYGVWRIVRGHTLPKTNRSLRLLLQTSKHSAILYSASDISVWPTPEIEQHPFLQRIGPDILDQRLDWQTIASRLASAPFARRSLSALYLDQAFLAGNGNYLRSEILHRSKLDPAARPVDLSRGELGRLARTTLEISRRSYETGGITLGPKLAKGLVKQGLPRRSRRFYAFGRTGLPCYQCDGEIQRTEAGSRRLYLCPKCQS